jgi:hypothetical protein
MIDHPSFAKKTLVSLIRDMSLCPALYAKKPEKNFTRKRKLPFEEVMNLLSQLRLQSSIIFIVRIPWAIFPSSFFGCLPFSYSLIFALKSDARLFLLTSSFLFLLVNALT